MRDIEEIIDNPKIKIRFRSKESVAGEVVLKGVKCSLVVSWTEKEGEHVSVSPFNQKTPTWDMMAQLKDFIFKDEEEAYQIHPPKSEYVNIKKNCLHIWRRTDGRRLFDVPDIRVGESEVVRNEQE